MLSAAQPIFTNLYNFSDTPAAAPNSGVAIGPGGVLYGTTPDGGAFNAGAVCSLTPPATAGGAWTENVLYSFTGDADGDVPSGVSVGPNGVDLISLEHIHADIVIDHQIGQLFPIHQHDPFFNSLHILQSFLREARSCDENALSRADTFQTPGECQHYRTPHGVAPTLCLNINHVKSELIFLDDPVDSAIARFDDRLTGIFG